MHFTPILSLPWRLHALLAALSFMWLQWIKGVLDASYAASNHPVDYATGQTGFDAGLIKSYYAHMQDMGTLNIYFQTQLIDFGFILGVALMGVCLCTLVARLSPQSSWGRHMGLIAAICALIGAACDATENLISFVMLANPAEFANWLALPYSAFAVVKFAMISCAMVCVVGSLMLAAVNFARQITMKAA